MVWLLVIFGLFAFAPQARLVCVFFFDEDDILGVPASRAGRDLDSFEQQTRT